MVDTIKSRFLKHVIHCKKSFSIFPSPAGMSLTKLSLGGNNLYMTSLFPPRKSLVIDIPAGDGNIKKLFLQCSLCFPYCALIGVEYGKVRQCWYIVYRSQIHERTILLRFPGIVLGVLRLEVSVWIS